MFLPTPPRPTRARRATASEHRSLIWSKMAARLTKSGLREKGMFVDGGGGVSGRSENVSRVSLGSSSAKELAHIARRTAMRYPYRSYECPKRPSSGQSSALEDRIPACRSASTMGRLVALRLVQSSWLNS